MERQLRREENNLVVIGSGLILFGLWSVLKIFLITYLQYDELTEGTEIPEGYAWLGVVFLVVFVALFAAFVLGLRVYIGRSAIAEGQRKGKRRHYIGAAVVLAVLDAFLLGTDIWLFGADSEPLMDAVIDVIIDLTSLVVVIELIVSAFRVRKLRKSLGTEGV